MVARTQRSVTLYYIACLVKFIRSYVSFLDILTVLVGGKT